MVFSPLYSTYMGLILQCGELAQMDIERDSIASLIFYLRGEKVMFDFHLAMLYGVGTKVLNQAVKRNLERFPGDFMFQLTDQEWEILRSQIVTSSWGGRRSPPYVFTEQGVAMLAGVLKSTKAIGVNILIMRAFVFMRKMVAQNEELKVRIEQLESKYDSRFSTVFEAIKQLINREDRPRNPIGFKVGIRGQ